MMLAEELRAVPVFADLPSNGLEWLASQMTEVQLAPGEVAIREGSPADRMFVILEGEIRSQPISGALPAWVVRAPDVTGMLPYSRMTHFPAQPVLWSLRASPCCLRSASPKCSSGCPCCSRASSAC